MSDKNQKRYIVPCKCDHYETGVIEEHHHFDDSGDIVDWRDYDDDDYILIEKKENESYEEADKRGEYH